MGIPNLDADIERITSFDGTHIATACWGDPGASTIILSNGICCTDTYWTFLQPLLVDIGYRVIFFDYRGHNRSGRPMNPNEVTLPAHARDLWAVADHYGVESASLIGHSMGVQTTFEAYRKNPDRVDSIIALAGPFEYPLDHIYMTPVGAALLAGFELSWKYAPSPVRAAWRATGLDTHLMVRGAQVVGAVGRTADGTLLDEYFANVGALDPLLVLKFFRGMQMHSARDVLEHCDIPVLQIAGSRDVLTPLPLQREMASLLPDVQFEIVRKATHTLPIDDPELINEMIVDFLAKVYPDPKPSKPQPRKQAAKKAAKKATKKATATSR